MSTLSDLVLAQGRSSAADVEWLHMLLADSQLLADLAFADIVIWVPTDSGSFIAVAHSRPSSAATLFYRDFVGQSIKQEWRKQVTDCFESGRIIESSAPDWYEETPTRVRAVPVARRISPTETTNADGPIAVITRHTNLGEARTPSRQELTFNDCASDLFEMIAVGDFPDLGAPTGPRRGAPRASDGLIRLDVDGTVTFASPNALSAFNRIGFAEELEGESLADVTTHLLSGTGTVTVDESLPLVVTGRAPWRTDIEDKGVTVSLRAIPLRSRGERVGAIVLCRDVSELRHQEQELITKDATIREIHHRVKNNLQTVASLLRIQARRTHSEDAHDALTQAMRRVAAIAVVHDTLSEGLNQNVDFDEVFERVLLLIAEVASSHNTTVRPKSSGSFGVLPSEYATPLALALTELVTNAVEHGLNGRDGDVEITADRTDELLSVQVRDNGVGLPEGKVGSGLGTQIVRTLIQGELGGTIDWHTLMGSGTEVTIAIPMRWVAKS
ncbi:histidine kinase N-terminal domain-containing protein [Plantibacter sp. VKM Ac-2885]|uniref:histidine kinase n=3 Tax=Plantibacter TaxID=190323 RepID=A0A1S7BAN2_9MICO|nr:MULTISPECIES: PAS domain-containing sensor histidine kinase [Plantibacter]MBD8103500.1 histidine kinase N-terminal domain-containing protein [Plantibacter sp. CFBP 8775]MBD8468355.1 histidine kinase N-terminal domain-containing protein [Plantibacter sp. CFBP 8798]MBD8516646.1 histidine kinase N-terminal domain-containing protein [Plantibacter sp. CFBP 8804]MBF4514447.1 histidine kinase N-terminal domain-containing protein [Plantibacter sp. VKM Ac-2885]MBF4566926.1 histidine kinase N-termina